MGRKVLKITENELKGIIRNSVKKILNESVEYVDDVDISKIPIEDLKQGYKDFRLVPTSSFYGHPLYEPVTIKEAVGDIFPPDEAVKGIIQKYDLPESLVYMREHHHNVFVYSIVAKIGINDQIIEEDMKKLGYFLAKKLEVVNVDGMIFQKFQYEPYSQYQEDITDMIKSKFKFLYHWTPAYNVESIIKNGLIPNSRNTAFKYPPRTYLMEGDSDFKKMFGLGQQLCAFNKDPNNDGTYTIIIVNIENLDNSIRFFYDPNSSIGIYTEHPIPNKNIKAGQTIKFVKNIKNE